MKRTHLLLALALLGALSLSPLAAAAEKVPTAEQVCTALTKGAKKQSGKAAKGRLALASAIKRLAKEPEDVNVRSKGKGLTPLMIAAALGEKDAVAWLLSIGADPTVKDAAGKDAFARTKNTAITKLLKEGAILSWDEAIAYLESIRPENWPEPPSINDSCRQDEYKEGGSMSRSGMLERCRKLAEAQTAYKEKDFLTDCATLGLNKMVSFLIRDCSERGYFAERPATICFEDWQYFIPSDLWLPLFNLYKAHQGEIQLGHPNYREEIATNAKLCRWISEHLGWEESISTYGAVACAPMVITASLQSIKDSPTPVPADKLQEALDLGLKWCVERDADDAKAGKPVNPHRLEAAQILLEAGAQCTMDENHPDAAQSAEMKKLLKTAAKKKQGE